MKVSRHNESMEAVSVRVHENGPSGCERRVVVCPFQRVHIPTANVYRRCWFTGSSVAVELHRSVILAVLSIRYRTSCDVLSSRPRSLVAAVRLRLLTHQ